MSRWLLPALALLTLTACRPDTRSQETQQATSAPTTSAPTSTCAERVRAATRATRLPMTVFRVEGQQADCSDLQLIVAGLVTPPQAAEGLRKQGLALEVEQVVVLGPARLQREAAPAGPLRVVAPERLTGQSGGQVGVHLRLTNAGQQKTLLVGPTGFNYELLDAAGEVVYFPGLNGQLGPTQVLDCPTDGECALAPLTLPLYRMNPALPLPAGEYTLRISLKNLGWNEKHLDLGIFDLPVTVTP